MAELKEQLRSDLSAAMKDRNEVVRNTLRMALSAVRNAEVSAENARELTDEEVRGVLGKEAKKRDESAESFAAAGRQDQADAEQAEADVLRGYLPAQLDDAELAELVEASVSEAAEQLGEHPGMKQMGQVMKVAQSKVAGRAEGGRVAAEVKRRLQD